MNNQIWRFNTTFGQIKDEENIQSYGRLKLNRNLHKNVNNGGIL